jgi:hypothetical protein
MQSIMHCDRNAPGSNIFVIRIFFCDPLSQKNDGILVLLQSNPVLEIHIIKSMVIMKSQKDILHGTNIWVKAGENYSSVSAIVQHGLQYNIQIHV